MPANVQSATLANVFMAPQSTRLTFNLPETPANGIRGNFDV